MSGPDSRRVVVVDDSPVQCAVWKRLFEGRYGCLADVETYSNPALAVEALGPDVHVMLLDWEMPDLDGCAVLERARARGVNLKRVIITSGHSADELHEVFDATGCLAVIEKDEPAQQAAFMMILDSIMKR